MGVIPRDHALRVACFTSPHLCPEPPAGIRLLGVVREALPHVDEAASSPEEHQALARQLQSARDRGARVLLLSLGTVVTRMFAQKGATHVAFLKRLYTTLAASALRSGAVVVASTCDSSAADLGIDEAALGATARNRVFAMPFLPQPFLFARGLVDVMLTHGGANTFHEAVLSGIPLLVSPGFGDQASVAQVAAKLGIGVCVEAIMYPELEGAVPLERVAEEVLPAMLAPGISRWKREAMCLAALINQENGLDAAEALLRPSTASPAHPAK
jgi:UDP:flavonoid glycosyltransferase YjiC (YdhE family)